MRVTILGGTGPIGRSLIRALKGEADITVLSRSASAIELDRTLDHAKAITGDFQDQSVVRKALEGADAVVHLVTCGSPSESNETPLLDLDANIRPTIGVLDACVNSGVSYIVFASSGGTVYGSTDGKPTPEYAQTLPISAYGVSKLAIEKYLHLYSLYHGLPYAALRISSPYGIDSLSYPIRGVVDTFLHAVLSKKRITVWGDGSAVRDFIHLSEVASAFAATLRLRPLNVVMNVGSGVGTSLSGLLSDIETITGNVAEVQRQPPRRHDVASIVLDCSLARELIQWNAGKGLLEGIAESLSMLIRTPGH